MGVGTHDIYVNYNREEKRHSDLLPLFFLFSAWALRVQLRAAFLW